MPVAEPERLVILSPRLKTSDRVLVETRRRVRDSALLRNERSAFRRHPIAVQFEWRENHQPLRLRHWHRPKNHGVQHAEHGVVAPICPAQRHDGGHAKPGILPQIRKHSEDPAQLIERSPPHISRNLLYQGDVPKSLSAAEPGHIRRVAGLDS